MAGVPDDFNEDDFENYNPYPYRGGYDLAQTYGQPLPPSAAICYPISFSVSLPPTGKVNLSPDSVPVNEVRKESEPESEKPVSTPVVESPDRVPVNEVRKESEPESEKPVSTPVVEQPWFEPHPYDEPYQPEPYKPDLFRSWPFSNRRHHCCHKRNGVRDFDYWNHMMRGLDFLFGHAQGYGERRVGTDVYGIPMYANKKSPTESVAFLVEQPSVQRLEYHQSSDVEVHPDGLESKSSLYEERKEEKHEKYGNSYQNDDSYNYEQRTSNWGHDSSYLDTYHDWRYNIMQPSWYEERKEEKHEKYGNSYQIDDSCNYEQRTSNWGHDLSYHDTYHDWRYNNLGYSSNVEGEYMEENKVLTTPVYSYNQHCHEQPLHVQVEPADQTWTQKMISYENNHSSYYEKGEEMHQPNILSHGYDRERYEETQYEHLEPYKPSWSQNFGYYGKYLEGDMVRSEDYSTFYGDEGNVSTAFTYNEGNTYYEQNQSSWSTGDSHVLYGDDTSIKPNGDDEPSKWTDAIFGSAHNYYAYGH
ncbi:uncharacterized protein LOC144556056 isoform X3 [Carex rostrata]